MALIFALSVTLVGCGGSPTNLEEQPLFFSGSLAFLEVDDLSFTLDDDDIVRIDIVDLTPVLVDITARPNFVPTIGFGLGSPTAEGTCVTRQRSATQEGGSFTFGLNAGDYCIQLSDVGFFTEETIVSYTVSISSVS